MLDIAIINFWRPDNAINFWKLDNAILNFGGLTIQL
jgi:hypothetical protein